jgi:Tfp pilus assembly protein PilX
MIMMTVLLLLVFLALAGTHSLSQHCRLANID